MDRARAIYKNFGQTIAERHFLALLIVLTELVGSFDPLLEHLDELLNVLEEQVIQLPKEAQIEQLVRLRKQLWTLHRIWEPQRGATKDLLFSIRGMIDKNVLAEQIRAYTDHISDLLDRIDDLRQRAAEAMESYGTSVSNKQSQVINRLTIISAVFLPLTFLTGFFGMNFQWMIDCLHSLAAFLFLGIGLFIAMLTATLLLFRSRRWLGKNQARKPEAGPPGPTALEEQTAGAQKKRARGESPAQIV